MNKTADHNLANSNMLEVINEKLVTYKSIILYQKEEILKTEAVIKQYTDHLDRQNDALKLYLEEEEELIKIKNEIIKNNDCQHNTNNIIEDVQIFNKENINEGNLKENSKEINFVNEFEIMYPQNDKFNQNLDEKIKSHLNDVSTINITEINNETVYSICFYYDNIYIGGSNGMLLKNSYNQTFTFKTNTKEDILQIEIMKNKGNLTLFALSKETVIIFKNIEEPQLYQHIYLPGIEHVYKNNYALYIPLEGGIIHKVDTLICTIKELKLPNNECISSIATGHRKRDFSLVVFKNGLLYKCKLTEDSINNFQHVKGFKNLKRVKKIVEQGYVYYSDTTIWIADYNLKNTESEKFENGIKFVDFNENYLVVVDHNDTLHIFMFINKNSINKCYSQKITGNITAMKIYRHKVYLSVGNEIFILNDVFKFQM